MCGIAGTVFNRNYSNGIEVYASHLFEALNQFKLGELSSNGLLELTWKYKSNINFIRFCKISDERVLIRSFCNSVKSLVKLNQKELHNIDKSISNDAYKKAILDVQNLLDVDWFLSVETPNCLRSIEYLADNKISLLSDEIIIFYKDLIKVIGAIDNRLELRGRDSFGISVVINTNDSNFEGVKKDSYEKKSESFCFIENKKLYSLSFAFRVSNSIGSLGENAQGIRKLIKKSNNFKNLLSHNKFESATIMAHTRWASVGDVNLENTHPLTYTKIEEDEKKINISSILNGDIYNYKEIIKNAKSMGSFSIDEGLYTTDCAAIPAFLIDGQDLDLKKISKISNNLNGSFVIGIQHSSLPSEILLLKKGIQGLYLGFSYDGIMFASDVYGLVESCRFFTTVESDYSISISADKIGDALNPNISLWNNKIDEFSQINSSDLKVTNITTRDIDKKGYPHFLEKEIFETADIVTRTVSNYIQPKKSYDIDSLKQAIAVNGSQIPEYIISNLVNREINKIIITGMGTCYTAAVAISMFMRARLKELIPSILVEPHIASEGSAFYIQPNMQDTLVIVVAQSGTTVDTNVYVQMAKTRGAMSLAIANKREGDVTFIVDGTLYTGDGRDIEIAVPSTKTYSAHVILGYILTIFLASNLAKKPKHKQLLFNDIENLREAGSLINKSLKLLDDKALLNRAALKGCAHDSWFIVRDQTSNSVCAEEIRIKYSENCYQSVSSLTIAELQNAQIKNSFIILITEGNTRLISKEIIDLIQLNNSLVIISTGLEISNDLLRHKLFKKIIFLGMPKSKEYFAFLPTILAGQVLSYHQALVLDDRKNFFIDLEASLGSKKEIYDVMSKYYKKFVEKNFKQGFTLLDFNELQRLLKNYIKEGLNKHSNLYQELLLHLNKMMLNSRRTIDTIKHQAKTITVGSVRAESESGLMSNQFSNQQNPHQVNDSNLLNLIINSFECGGKNQLPLFDERYSETLISYEGIDEAFAYNISNILNDISIQNNKDPNIKLARHYDSPSKQKSSSSFWIILSEHNIDKNNSFLRYLSDDQYVIFNFSEYHFGNLLEGHFFLSNIMKSDYRKSLWSLFLGLYLCKKWLIPNILKIKPDHPTSIKILFEIKRQLNSLIYGVEKVVNSPELSSSLKHAFRVFLIRKNWKCIGSGVNFNIAKFTAKKITKKFRSSCAFDVLENHKHIDISAESAIIIFVANIWKQSYQDDAYSEIAKLTAHNNIPIIITNEGDERFDNMSLNLTNDTFEDINLSVPIIKIAKVGSLYTFPLSVLVLERFVEEINKFTNVKNKDEKYQMFMQSPEWEYLNENIWQ